MLVVKRSHESSGTRSAQVRSGDQALSEARQALHSTSTSARCGGHRAPPASRAEPADRSRRHRTQGGAYGRPGVYPSHVGLVVVCEEMGIDGVRRADVGVPHPSAHLANLHPCGGEDAGVAVSQVVEAQVAHENRLPAPAQLRAAVRLQHRAHAQSSAQRRRTEVVRVEDAVVEGLVPRQLSPPAAWPEVGIGIGAVRMPSEVGGQLVHQRFP